MVIANADAVSNVVVDAAADVLDRNLSKNDVFTAPR